MKKGSSALLGGKATCPSSGAIAQGVGNYRLMPSAPRLAAVARTFAARSLNTYLKLHFAPRGVAIVSVLELQEAGQ
jgi:hypothetical protein